MDAKLSQNTNSISSGHIVNRKRIMLIDGKQQLLQPLHKALQTHGYQPRLFNDPNQALLYLSKTDILLLDVDVAQQPKSSKFIKVPTILVLTKNSNITLPPWLQSHHVFLVHHPQEPRDLIEQLADYLPPRIPDFGIAPSNTEHLALLFGITQFLSGHLDINDLFERILALTPYLRADFSGLLVQEGSEIIYYRSTEPGREEMTGATGRRFAQRLIKDGLEGWVLRHNQATVIANTTIDSRWFRASYLPDEAHCVVASPINLERVDAQGVYLIGHKTPDYFSKNDIPLLEAATIQIGLAIENALLFKNQSQRSIQLALINEVGQAATSILNLDVMLRTVVQAIRRSFACYSVSVYLATPDIDQVELRARTTSERFGVTTSQHPQQIKTQKLHQGLIGWSAANNKTVLANDVTRDPRFVFNNYNREIRAELCVPIALGVKTIGVLDLQSAQIEAFDKFHVSALETLADQLAIAIENARLYDEINQHVKELKSLNEIGQAITSVLDLQKTLTLVTDHTTRLLDVAAASVVLRDDKNGDIWFAAASGEGAEAVIGVRMAVNQGIAGWVTTKGEAIIVPDVYTDERFFTKVDQQSGFTTQSILCVPLQARGETIGAIEVMNKKSNVSFNNKDLSLLQALAISAATAIDNAQLYQEQTRTIDRLAETQSQLVQSSKLAAVGELAAGVAHEINNPLTTIIGLTSLLINPVESTTLKHNRIEDLQMISQEARQARDIVRSLLDFAHADTPKRQPVDFNQLIEEAIFLVYTQAVSQIIELKKELTPLPEVFLDNNQIKQVIVNLLNNAVQSLLDNNDQTGTLTIATTLVPPVQTEKDVFIPKLIMCTISDTGKGIKPEHLDKVFDPFFTTKEVGQGTGLGLSISYGIIEKHQGSIDVESSMGNGCTFTLILPATPPPTEDIEPAQSQ